MLSSVGDLNSFFNVKLLFNYLGSVRTIGIAM